VIAVSRFSGTSAEDEFRRHGVETIKADLLDPEQLDGLPERRKKGRDRLGDK